MPFPSGVWVSVAKSADSLMGVPLYVICHFSFVAFNMLSVFNFCQFDYCVSRCVPPWVYPAWDSVFPGLGLFPFPCLGSFQLLSLQIFSQVLSLFFWDPYIMWMLGCLTLSQRSLRLASFLFILFHSIFCSVAVISTILFSRWFICSSTSLILLDCF